MPAPTYQVSPDVQRLSGTGPEAVSVGFTDRLDSGVTLTLVSITEADSKTLTIGSKAVNTATFDVEQNGETITVAVGQGVQCTVAAGTVENSPYTLLIEVTTSDSQTLQYGQRVTYGSGDV